MNEILHNNNNLSVTLHWSYVLALIPFKLQYSQLVSLWKSSHSGYKKWYCHCYTCQINKGDIWLQFENNEKKSARWRCDTEKSKTNTKKLISPLLTHPQGCQGCQKMHQDLLNMLFEVWCAKIAPKLKNIRKCLRKQFFFSILTIFEVCAFFGQS